MTRSFAAMVALAATLAAPAVAAAADPDPDPWISRDKALHFDVSAGIAAVGYGAGAGWLGDARWKALALGGGLALAAGAGKEIVDATGLFGGGPSWKDLAWDVIGAVAGLALAWTVDLCLGGVNAAHPALGAPATGAAAVKPVSVTVRF